MSDDRRGGGSFEGLRERKKRQMRELISGTATQMFLERGFEEVRVTEVAERCGVSEKTVYNYFPTKESLVLDREEGLVESIRRALGPGAPARSPIAATVEVLKEELDEVRARWDERGHDEALMERFVELIENTPSLRAAQRDMMDRLVQAAAEALAERAGVSPLDPEPQIAATAIVGLWRVQYQALRLAPAGTATVDEVCEEVSTQVARAARLVDTGLWAFEVMVHGRGTRAQVRAAAEAAQSAGRQVAAALRQARDAWRMVQSEHRAAHAPGGDQEPWFAGPKGGGHPGFSSRKEVQEWRAAELELRKRYMNARRQQQRMFREALHARQAGSRARQAEARARQAEDRRRER